MNTPDIQSVAYPDAISVMAVGPADLARGASPAAASPGASPAMLRVPTAPTLPEADPASLLLAVSRVANELFADSGPGGISALAPESVSGAPSSGSGGSSGLGAGSGLGAAPGADRAPGAAAPLAGPGEALVPAGLASPAAASASGPAAQRSPSPAAVAPNSGAIPAAQPHEINPFTAQLEFGDALTAEPNGHGAPDADFRWPIIDLAPPASSQTVQHVQPAAPTLPPLDFEVQPLVDTGVPSSPGGLDAHRLKKEFPILQQQVHGRPLVWLDNAATTQKPSTVIERLKYFYKHENSNIHRAAHTLAARATDAYEEARESVRRFVNASSVRDVVFVRGTTEGINLVAQTWGRRNLQAGDEIVLTHLEHHANIVPWQLIAAEKGARLRVAPVDDDGQIILEEYEKLFNSKTKLAALPQVSNALGTVTPAQAMIEIAHRHGAKVLLDGAQSVSHMHTDLQILKPDFFVFSGHKVFAPTGIGAVVAPADLLDTLPPWQGGGNMIADVTFERTQFQAAPARFEAGTGNIADAVGLGAALDWVRRVGIASIAQHEHDLLVYGTQLLKTVEGLRIIGTAREKAGVLSFVIAGHDTQAVSSALDKEGIAVRGGHHCAQPILRRFGLESTVRASLAPYNTHEDLDALVAALCRITGQRGPG